MTFTVKTKNCLLIQIVYAWKLSPWSWRRVNYVSHIRKNVWLSLVDPISEAKGNIDVISGNLTIDFCSQNSYCRMWVSTVISYGHCSFTHSTVYLCDIIVIQISCNHMNPLSIDYYYLVGNLILSLLMCDIYDMILKCKEISR